MRQTWNMAVCFVLLGVVAIAFGLWTLHLAGQRENEVAELEAASLQLDQYERDGTLDERTRDAAARRAWLAARLEASTRGASALDRRLGELFTELDLVVTSTTPWAAPDDGINDGAHEFERTVQCTGSFAALLDAIASLEAWPDLTRVRELTVVPDSPGKVTATLRLSVLRLPVDTAVAVAQEGS